jgi:hypothetical protein
MLRMVALARAKDKGAKVEILNLGNLDPSLAAWQSRPC